MTSQKTSRKAGISSLVIIILLVVFIVALYLVITGVLKGLFGGS